MTQMNVDIVLDEISKNLKDKKDKLMVELLRQMNKACDLVEEESRDRCPVDEGALRDSMTSKAKVSGSKVEGVVYTDKDYAIYVHQGTGIYAAEGDGRKTPWVYADKDGKFHRTEGQRPQPYLENALNSKKEEIKKLFTGVLGK